MDLDKQYYEVDYDDITLNTCDDTTGIIKNMFMCCLWDNKPFVITNIIVADTIETLSGKLFSLDNCVVKCCEKKLKKRMELVKQTHNQTIYHDNNHGFYFMTVQSTNNNQSKRTEAMYLINHINDEYNFDKYHNAEYYENIVYYLS